MNPYLAYALAAAVLVAAACGIALLPVKPGTWAHGLADLAGRGALAAAAWMLLGAVCTAAHVHLAVLPAFHR